jgi:Holliday junction DNA helicase RuvA
VIARISGVLSDRSGDTVVIQTEGGVGYQLTLPLGVMERLPPMGARCSLYTELVVREDGWTLYGFDRPADRGIFQRLLLASGFGPKLAMALLSTLGPDRTVRSIQGKDLAALSTVPGIGRKKAERLVVELSDRFSDLATGPVEIKSTPATEAARALGSLGYQAAAADDAVRAALAQGATDDIAALIKRALHHLTTARGGR